MTQKNILIKECRIRRLGAVGCFERRKSEIPLGEMVHVFKRYKVDNEKGKF